MKKNLQLCMSVVLALLSFTAWSQCTIDNNNTNGGLSSSLLPCANQGVVYGQSQQIYIPSVGPGGITIDSARVTGITGLPAGITYTLNPASGYFAPNSHGCVWFSGTTNAAIANYPLTVNGFLYTSSGAIPLASLLTDTFPICAYVGCIIDPLDTNPGLDPQNLPCISAGVVYGQIQSFYVPASIPNGPVIDSVVITNITGLPAGITFSLNPVSGVFPANTHNCIWFSGTTNSPAGNYGLTFTGTLYTTTGPIPLSDVIQDTISICGASGCVLDLSDTTPGFSPQNLPCITDHNSYGESQQIHVPLIVPGGGGATVDSVVITGITGMPNGITAVLNPANGILHGGATGCVWFSGTTNSSPGNYGLNIAGTVYTSAGNFPASVFNDTLSICNTASPTPNFGAQPTTICANSSVSFTDSSSNSPNNWNWSFPGGNPPNSNDRNPVVIYSTPGTYNVTLTVSNGNGTNSTTKNNYITVVAAPAVQVLTAPSTCTHSTGSAWAVVTGTVGTNTYLWSNSGQRDTITGLSAGIYSVTVTSQQGCSVTSSGSVFNSNGPIVTLSNTEPSCYFSTNGNIIAHVTGGSTPYTYTWGNSGDTKDTLANIGAGTYTLTVVDHNDCVAYVSDSLSQPNFVNDFINTTPSSGSDGTAWASPSGGTSPYTFAWSNGGSTDTITGLAPGTYVVTVTDSHGCTDSRSGTVNSAAAQISVTFTNTEPLCYTSTNGRIIANPSGGTSPYSYNWQGSGVHSDTLSSIGAGVYTVTVTDHNGASAVVNDTLGQPTFISSSVSTTPSSGSNGTATDVATGGTSPYTYLWSDGQTTATATGLAAGSISATVTDSHGCTDNRSGVVGTVGIADLGGLLSNISIYPNPASDQMFISLNLVNAATIEFKLFDLDGKTIYANTETSGQGKVNQAINVKDIPSGLYILELRANGQSLRTKISIVH